MENFLVCFQVCVIKSFALEKIREQADSREGLHLSLMAFLFRKLPTFVFMRYF